MCRKSISVAVVLCFLGMGSFASGGSFGGPWSFQADWGATMATCKPAVPPLTKDWYDVDNWGLQNNGNNGCGCPFMTGSYYFMVIESKAPEPCVSTTSFYWPGIDANGYDSYATQIFIMPWAWEYAPAGFRVTVESGNINAGRMIALAYNVEWPAAWNAYPILDVNGGTIYTPGYRNFDANNCTDTNHFDDPAYPWYVGDGLWVGGGGSGLGENWGFVNIRNTGKIIVPRVRIYNGEVNLFPNGLLYETNSIPDYFFISQTYPRNKINVAGGELRLAGDRAEQVAYYVSKGRIVACQGHGDLNVDYNGVDTSVTSVCTPDSAWNPNPIDSAIAVPLNKVLSWSAGPSTQPPGSGNAHDVYFGTDFNEVNDATTPIVSQDACSYNPGALLMDTCYFWRIDERNGTTLYKGNMWMFRSKGPQATDPIPATGTAGLPLPIVVKWNPGNKASGPTAHAVYFGTSQDDVGSASVTNPLGCFKGYVTDPVYRLSNLDFDLAADTDYYWRIDESNGIDVWKGDVWQFTNTNYFVIEDFESYTDNVSMQAKWKMGRVDYAPCGFNNSNGVIDFNFSDGEGAMQFDYDNGINQHFSEVRFDANDGNAGGSDWTGGGALPDNNKCRSMAISFIGNTNNDADPYYDRMYAAIEDTAGNFQAVLNSDPQAQRSFGWTQWYINLSDLSEANNVSLANIKYLYIGFGDRCYGVTPYGGAGSVIFDDIRLYQKTCLPQFLPVGDLSGDCKVNLIDLDVMANAWLAKQAIISPVTNPGTTGLRLWYQFNETTGITVTDSSGNGYDGEVNSAPTFAGAGQSTAILWDSTGGFDGSGCFVSSPLAIRDFNMSIEADANALDANGISLTLSIWVNGDTYMPLSSDLRPRIICAFQDIDTASDDDNEVLEIQCPVPRTGTSSTARFRIGVLGESNEVSSAGMPLSAFAGSWQHYAFVLDGAAKKIRIYHNGEMIADANATSSPFRHDVGFESFRLIRRNQGSESWYGKLDDFRVYNRALSQAEVGWLGTQGTGVVPFMNASNLKGGTPEKISFNDLAIFAKNWLTYQSWPNP